MAAGQIVKFREFGGVDLFVNGTLTRAGTSGSPIVFTSTRDDTVGTDAYNDGNAAVYAGQSNGLTFGSTRTASVLDFIEARFAGANAKGAVFVNGGGLLLSDGVVRDSSTHGVMAQSGADVRLINDLIASNSDAGIRVESLATVTTINCTIDDNFRGVAVDGNGTRVVLTNNLITNNVRAGVAVTNRGGVTASFNDVLNLGAADGNYSGLTNLTGQSGNVSVDPKFVARATLDYHLQSSSPVIDAATSDSPPIDDLGFNFRSDDPATPNTGAGPSPFFDMGAFEFGGRPRAVKHFPNGGVSEAVSKVLLTFRAAMNTTSFAPGDDVVSFTGPAGAIAVAGFQRLNRFQLQVTFGSQVKAGDYQLVIGPNILDADGNALDVDADGVRGEVPDDRYAASWTITPPRIIRQSPVDFVAAPIDHVDFTFDRTMDQQSFVPADDVVSITGPNGAVSTTGFNWLDSRTLRVSFAPQSVLGPYEIVLGPMIADVGGNLLDQSRNGVGGEVPVDRYTAAFTIADIIFVAGRFRRTRPGAD